MEPNDPLLNQDEHNTDINPELQEKMNTPPVDPDGFSTEDEQFLHEVLDKINSGNINVYSPTSLLNEAIYEKLDDESKARVETKAHSILATIRQLESAWNFEKKPTYLIKNLIHKLRTDKEQFELKEGDVFII